MVKIIRIRNSVIQTLVWCVRNFDYYVIPLKRCFNIPSPKRLNVEIYQCSLEQIFLYQNPRQVLKCPSYLKLNCSLLANEIILKIFRKIYQLGKDELKRHWCVILTWNFSDEIQMQVSLFLEEMTEFCYDFCSFLDNVLLILQTYVNCLNCLSLDLSLRCQFKILTWFTKH